MADGPQAVYDQHFHPGLSCGWCGRLLCVGATIIGAGMVKAIAGHVYCSQDCRREHLLRHEMIARVSSVRS